MSTKFDLRMLEESTRNSFMEMNQRRARMEEETLRVFEALSNTHEENSNKMREFVEEYLRLDRRVLETWVEPLVVVIKTKQTRWKMLRKE